jgi:hypothetical protein
MNFLTCTSLTKLPAPYSLRNRNSGLGVGWRRRHHLTDLHKSNCRQCTGLIVAAGDEAKGTRGGRSWWGHAGELGALRVCAEHQGGGRQRRPRRRAVRARCRRSAGEEGLRLKYPGHLGNALRVRTDGVCRDAFRRARSSGEVKDSGPSPGRCSARRRCARSGPLVGSVGPPDRPGGRAGRQPSSSLAPRSGLETTTFAGHPTEIGST